MMTEEKQRIAIAEACGWKPDDDGDGTGWKGSWIHQRLIGMKPTFHNGKVVSYLIEQTVPDYCNDLNAMHEAESRLKQTQRLRYAEKLMEVTRAYPIGVVSDWDGERKSLSAVAHATAAQRAEAFLRTLNLWSPTQP